MSSFKLNLPTDIPWSRRCVSEDMIDTDICDPTRPYRWRSSVAIFEYEPPEDVQEYADLTISYLKVSCTITGYQEDSDEIGLDFDDVRNSWNDAPGIDNYLDALEKYYACYGAIVEVLVGTEAEGVDIDDYPYFLDFEPKKRELYEMSTDIGEISSRSLSAVEVGKSTSSLKAHEVLDVDRGWRVATSASSSFGGGSSDISQQGEWGTKDITQTDKTHTTAANTSQEMRETQSHVTQLSQMYHQLDSYHLGTNRAVFFIHPRPHVIENEHTFVNGPRNIEGTQDFFLVVARKNTLSGICPAVVLETGHIGWDQKPTTTTGHDEGSERVVYWDDKFEVRDAYKVAHLRGHKVWYVDEHHPGFVIVDASVEIGVPEFYNAQGIDWQELIASRNPNDFVDEIPTMDWDDHTIEVKGRIHSLWRHDPWPDLDDRAGVRQPFRVRITLATPTQETQMKNRLFLTGRRLCCCERSTGTTEFVARPGIVYERPVPGLELPFIGAEGSQMSLKEANALGESLQRLLREAHKDGRYRISDGGFCLAQTDFATSNLALAEGIDKKEWAEVEIAEPLRAKVEGRTQQPSIRGLLAASTQDLRRAFGLSIPEIRELRNALTVPRPRPSTPGRQGHHAAE